MAENHYAQKSSGKDSLKSESSKKRKKARNGYPTPPPPSAHNLMIECVFITTANNKIGIIIIIIGEF